MYRNRFILTLFIFYPPIIFGASVHETSYSYLTHNKLNGAPTTKPPLKLKSSSDYLNVDQSQHKNDRWITDGKLPIYTKKRVKLKPPKFSPIDFTIQVKRPRLRTNILNKIRNSAAELTVYKHPQPKDSKKEQLHSQKAPKMSSQNHHKKRYDGDDEQNPSTEQLQNQKPQKIPSHNHHKKRYDRDDEQNQFTEPLQNQKQKKMSSQKHSKNRGDLYEEDDEQNQFQSEKYGSSWSFPSVTISLPSLKLWPFASPKVKEKDEDVEQLSLAANREQLLTRLKKTQLARIETYTEMRKKRNGFLKGIRQTIEYFI